MGVSVFKSMGIALQLLILVFSFCLIYFTFVYYPSVANNITLSLPFKNIFVDKVVVNAEGFPIETNDYKITYETDSSLYYVFVQGDSIDEYVENKLAAQLALKNTLQADSLCDLKIIYTSSNQLEVGSELAATSGCN